MVFPAVAMALSLGSLSPEVLERVAARRIFFGHQSVGANLLDGVTDLAQGRVTLRAARTPDAFATPALVHTPVGKNEDPASKVADFEAALAAIEGRAEVAFMKFCYVDFTPATDVEAVFSTYAAALERLRARYPAVTFVHLTVPLTVVQGGPKAWLKRLFGGAPWGERENAVRHRFNELLRTRLAGQPLFDLAAAEATKPDGTSSFVERDGQVVPALVPAYSDDGQHLNGEGRRRVAEALLTFLARLP